MKFFKNVTKNGLCVLKGAGGALALDFADAKFIEPNVSKIPMGDKITPPIRHILLSGLSIMAMDFKPVEEFAHGAAIVQLRDGVRKTEMGGKFFGISDDMSDDVVNAIESHIQDNVANFKKELSDDNDTLSYPGEGQQMEYGNR